MYKNYDDETLAQALPAAMALAVRRAVARGDVDADAARPAALARRRRRAGRRRSRRWRSTGPLRHRPLRRAAADARRATARELQAARRRSDRELLPLFRQAMEPAYPHRRATSRRTTTLVEAFGIEERFAARRRIVVVTGDPLPSAMAGPAIRAWEMAERPVRRARRPAASTRRRRSVASPTSRSDVRRRRASLRELDRWADVIIFQGFLLELAPWLKTRHEDPRRRHLRPVPPRAARAGAATTARRAARRRSTRRRPGAQRAAATAATSSSAPRTSSATSGSASWPALGRVNPSTYDERRDARLADRRRARSASRTTPPVQHRHGDQGRRRRASAPTTRSSSGAAGSTTGSTRSPCIRAVDRLAERHPDVRLFFLGMKHPNPDVPEMRMAGEARELADSLGLTGQARLLQRGLGAVRRAAELPARRRPRRQHALRPRRDGVLLPHPDPRLPVGGAADRRHRRATRSAT